MQEDGLVWKIALGIVIGALAIGALDHYQRQAAVKQLNAQLATINANAKLQSDRMQREMQLRELKRIRDSQKKAQERFEAKQLLPGQRCIGKNLFNRVENGWEQVTDGSAARKCGR